MPTPNHYFTSSLLLSTATQDQVGKRPPPNSQSHIRENWRAIGKPYMGRKVVIKRGWPRDRLLLLLALVDLPEETARLEEVEDLTETGADG
jgi:hypothetical protein